MKKKLVILIIILTFVLASSYIFKYTNVKKQMDKERVSLKTYITGYENPIEISGIVKAKIIKKYVLNSEIGQYDNIFIEDGQKVKNGIQLISYNIDFSKRERLIKQLNEKQQNINNLYQKLSVDPNNRELNAQLLEEQSINNQFEASLNKYDDIVYKSTHATFDGIIDNVHKENVKPGEQILSLVSNEKLIEGYVSEFEVLKLKKGQKVNIKVNSTNKTGTGEITKISEVPHTDLANESSQDNMNMESVDSSKSEEIADMNMTTQEKLDGIKDIKYKVTIENLDIPIRSGFSVDVSIPNNVIVIPKSVLGKGNDVYIVDQDNKVHRKDILIEKINGEIVIKKGLKKGDKLLIKPPKKMKDGEKVDVSS